MRYLLLIVFASSCPHLLLGQTYPVSLDNGGDEDLFNCIEFGHKGNIVCIYTSTDTIGIELSYLIELNKYGLIDTILIPEVSGPNNLHNSKGSNSLFIFGSDIANDSILKIVKWDPTGQFSNVNSIDLPGPLLYLGTIREIYGRYYILGAISVGSVKDDVFLVELDSLTDSMPRVFGFGLGYKAGTVAYDITPYNQTGYLLSFYGYPVSIQSGENQFVLMDSGLVALRAQTINLLFGVTQFQWLNDELYYSGGYINAHPSKPESHHDILIGIVDTVIDTNAQLTFKYFGGGKDTNEISSLNNLSIVGNSLYVGGTSFPGYIFPPLYPVEADFVVGKFDLALNEQWVRYLGFPDRNDFMMAVLALSDGGCLLAGTTYDYVNKPEPDRDLLFYRLDADGNVVTGKSNPPEKRISLQIYPNPTSGTLVINPEHNHSGAFNLVNTLGQNVGNWNVEGRTTLSVEGFPTGIYFYHFVTNKGEKASGQVVIAR